MSAEQGMALLRAVTDSPDPAHKLVYADWLEERGEVDLAHAYRWAASRGLHPHLAAARRWARWFAPTRGKRSAPNRLPRVVYGQLKRRENRLGGFKQYKSLHAAFARLAEALACLHAAWALTPARKT